MAEPIDDKTRQHIQDIRTMFAGQPFPIEWKQEVDAEDHPFPQYVFWLEKMLADEWAKDAAEGPQDLAGDIA